MTGTPAYTWLPETVGEGAVVLASSRRLARELRERYDVFQVSAGNKSWATAAIFYWQDWLAHQLESAVHDRLPLLLDNASATMLWEQSLDQTRRQDLLSIGGVVRHAQSAWTRLHDWEIALSAVAEAAATRDEHWFVRASNAYADRLAAANWTDTAQLANVCYLHLSDPAITWPGRIVHAGFDRIAPALSKLFSQLSANGVDVQRAPTPARSASPKFHSFDDNAGMWRAAGHWARQIIEENPGARVAIAAPDLESESVRIGRFVREGFAPGWQRGGDRYRQAVNVSFGQRLGEFPAIAVALQCLAFAASGISSKEISILLRSPFAGATDMAVRARLELQLRQWPDRKWTPHSLLAAFEDFGFVDTAADWAAEITALAELHKTRNNRLKPAEWAGHIEAGLAAFGWPGISALDSDEFQLVNRWRELLNQLARLDRVSAGMTLMDALRQLRRIAGDAVYQPEAGDGAINVMGLLETAGLEFDYLWIGGMDATRWPPTGNPLALVNRQLQKDHDMPDSSPSDTLAFARSTLDRLMKSADKVCLAWCLSEGDAELVPSPMLVHAGQAVSRNQGDPGWHARVTVGSGKRDRVADGSAPAVTPDEKIRGGAYTVQRVREEPFAAFAHGRLGAGQLDAFAPGLTPRLRGTLVHDALQLLLDGCTGQAELGRWDAAEIGQRTEQAAYRAQAKLARNADPVLRQLLALEKTRLQALLTAFLKLELQREPFTIVALERKSMLQRGPVRLDLRIDRIDRLNSGGLLLADYKTGAAKKFLDKDRAPKSVQMSVYACAFPEAIDALVFINIDSREMGYDGAGGEFRSGRLRVADDDWPEVLASWRGEVDELLERLAAGELGVNALQPTDKARPLALLSRVAELRRDG